MALVGVFKMHLLLAFHSYEQGKAVSVFTSAANVPSSTTLGYISTPVNPLPLTVKKYDTGGNQISPSVVIIIIILAVIFFLSGCLHLLIRYIARTPRRDPGYDPDNVTALTGQLQQLFHLHDSGVEQAFIDTLPLFLYKAVQGLKESSDCAVCLCEFEGEDTLRLLPKCSHAFHADCIDTWLLSHSTCPLCRASLLPDCSSYPPPVFALITSDQSGDESRELPTDTEGIESEGPRNQSTVSENGGSINGNSPLKARIDSLEKPDILVEDSEREDVVGKMMPIKLGKFRNLNGLDDSSIPSSSSNIDPKRSYSMGSYEYVLDHSNLNVFITPTAYRKQFSTKNLPLTPGHRPNLSESILPAEVERSVQMTPHGDFVSESRIIKALHSLRPKKDDATDNTRTNSGLQGHKLGIDMNTSGSEIGASGRSSKSWIRLKQVPSGSTENLGSSRRTVSFRSPLGGDSKLKSSLSRRTLSETEVLSWVDHEHQSSSPTPNPKSWDLESDIPASIDSNSSANNEGPDNSVSSLAKRTLNWLVSRQKRIVHASSGRTGQILQEA